jgi:hypothetical protein
MRSIILVAVAGLAVGLFNANRAEAMATPAPAGLGMAADEVAVTTPVHCRRFMHRHRFGHDWSRGCRIGVTVAPRGGVSVRTRTTIRSRTGSSSGSTTRDSTIGTRDGISTNRQGTSGPSSSRQTSGGRGTTGGTSGQSSPGGSGAGSSGTSSSTGGSSGAGSSGTSSSTGGSSGR